jgi:hypothetical protein
MPQELPHFLWALPEISAHPSSPQRAVISVWAGAYFGNAPLLRALGSTCNFLFFIFYFLFIFSFDFSWQVSLRKK